MSGSAHITNGGSSGMISTAGLELPYPLTDETSRTGKQCNICETFI